jgi:DNA-binding PadR family transcriptional regulator
MASAKPSNVAHVILGILDGDDAVPMSGYDIKQLIDKSARFFFAASYGQIYPELKKLAKAGLVTGVDDATGDRPRTAWSITKDGRDVLREWLLEDETRCEMRDQGLLRVFFADSLSPSERIEKLRQLKAQRVADLAEIEAIEIGPEADGLVMPELVLDYGIGMHSYVIDWCDRTIEKLKEDSGD